LWTAIPEPPASAARRNDLNAIRDIVDGNPGILETFHADTACGILCGGADSARLLVEHGADASEPDLENGRTAPDHARERGHDEVARLLRG